MSRVLLLVAALAVVSPLATAENPAAPQIDLREFARQRIELALEQVQPPVPAAQRSVAAREFLKFLRQTSRFTVERVERGEIDDAELLARVNVFLGDRPELRGETTIATDAGGRVRDALGHLPGAPADEAERGALVAAFLAHLRTRSPASAEALTAGRLAPTELESRLAVFLADRQAERSAKAGGTATTVLAAWTERFVTKNFGGEAERVHALALRGTIDEGGKKREFVLFRRHPDRVRLHYVQDGVVTLALGFDGELAWRQEANGRAVFLSGAEARALRELAEFDHPLIEAASRGVHVQRVSGELAGPGSVVLDLTRSNGVSLRSSIDVASLEERTVVRKDAAGRAAETRLSDYHRVGPLNLPHRQETWEDGKLRRTVVITKAENEPGLLAEFFARPDGGRFSFMDFETALDVIRRKNPTAAKPAATTGGGT